MLPKFAYITAALGLAGNAMAESSLDQRAELQCLISPISCMGKEQKRDYLKRAELQCLISPISCMGKEQKREVVERAELQCLISPISCMGQGQSEKREDSQEPPQLQCIISPISCMGKSEKRELVEERADLQPYIDDPAKYRAGYQGIQGSPDVQAAKKRTSVIAPGPYLDEEEEFNSGVGPM